MNLFKLAAIDIGSNAVRLLISNVLEKLEGAQFIKSQLYRLPIRLGTDVFSSGVVSEQNIEQLAKAMKAFDLIMNIHKVKDFNCFATSAMREAKNSKQVVNSVYKRSGITIDVIDGQSEAKIIFGTGLSDAISKKSNYLYIDVGGGSTEFTVFIKGKIMASKSFPVGSVRLLNKSVSFDFLKKNVRPWLKEQTKDLTEISCIGTGGNINKASKLLDAKDAFPINVTRLNKLYKTLSDLDYEDRIKTFNLNPDRADVIVPALSIYTAAMDWVNSSLIFVPKIGLSDGAIQLLYQKRKKENISTSVYPE